MLANQLYDRQLLSTSRTITLELSTFTHACQPLIPQQAYTLRPPIPTPPNNANPSPAKPNDPTNNSPHQNMPTDTGQQNRSRLVAQQALTCKLVLSISLSQQGITVRPSRRTLTRVASAAVASLVIVAPISTVSNADALSPASLPWTNGSDEAPSN